jgi:hypothetical protein
MVSNQGSEPAAFDIHGKPVEVDVGTDYDSYKTFEIEFENSPSRFSPTTTTTIPALHEY